MQPNALEASIYVDTVSCSSFLSLNFLTLPLTPQGISVLAARFHYPINLSLNSVP